MIQNKQRGNYDPSKHKRRPERVYALSFIWKKRMTEFRLDYLKMKSSTFPPPFFPQSLLALFPPAPAVGVSVLDVDVFLSSHAEMSAFRGERARKVPILLPG